MIAASLPNSLRWSLFSSSTKFRPGKCLGVLLASHILPTQPQQLIHSLRAHLSTLLLNGTLSLPEEVRQSYLYWCCCPLTMVPFALIFAPFLFFAVLVGASPHRLSHSSRINLPVLGALVVTPIGIAQGTTPISGVSQFAVKYASAQRWQNPVAMGIWKLPYALSTQPIGTLLIFF